MKKLKLFLCLMVFFAIIPSISYVGYVKGFIDAPVDPLFNGKINGWSCITGLAQSIDTHLYARDKNNAYYWIGVAQKTANEPAVATQCQLGTANLNLRFTYQFTDAQKAQYSGMKIYAFGIGINGVSNAPLTNYGQFPVPPMTSVINSTNVSFQWNNNNTLGCSSLRGTVLSFPGGDGTTHLSGAVATNPGEDQVADVVGYPNCVRYIQVFLKEGYRHTNRLGFQSVANFVNNVIATAKNKGITPGKRIYIGSSAGAHYGAAALDWTGSAYLNAINRSIFVSGPFAASISTACGNAYPNSTIRGAYQQATNINSAVSGCLDRPNYDVVKTSYTGARAYLSGNAHKIAILIGANDNIGCSPNTTCGWSPASEALLYIQGIGTIGDFSINSGQEATSSSPRKGEVITGGTHDLWSNTTNKRLVCKNILDEVGQNKSACTTI